MMREQHAAELAAIRDDLREARAQDIGGAFERVFERMTSRIEAVDPEQQLKRMQARTEALTGAFDRRQVETLQNLLVGERAYALTVMEPVKGVESPGGGFIFAPWSGLGMIVFASSESAAEAKYRGYFGIRGVSDDRWIFISEVPEAKREGLRQFLLRLTEGRDGEFKTTCDKLAQKMANDAQPKPPVAEQEDELAELISAE
jgi:hypothetical protein